MVAGERPVARCRARGDRLGTVQCPARPLLVEDQLQHLADGVRHHGPGADEHGPRHRVRIPPAYAGPADPEQQQAEDDQCGLRRQLQQGPRPARRITDRFRQRAVRGDGRPARDLGRAGPPQAAGGEHRDHGRRRSRQGERSEQPGRPVVLLCVLCHAANVRRGDGPARGPKGRSTPRRTSGLTPVRVASELPHRHREPPVVTRPRRPVRGERRLVVRLHAAPHLVAPSLSGEVHQRPGQGPADARRRNGPSTPCSSRHISAPRSGCGIPVPGTKPAGTPST